MLRDRARTHPPINSEARVADIALSNVSKRFGTTLAVDSLDLTVANGEFVVLLGPTGAGKTTTLRLVAGLELPDTGSIRIDGRDMTRAEPARRDVTFVFQAYSLYPHLSVYDNLAFPLRSPARRVPEPEITKRIQQVAKVLRIAGKLKNRATQLSGGEMQRVAIGRALVRRPAVYLMDEPLSSLDAKLRAELRLELKNIQQDLGATILYVTHDQIEAMTMANRIGILYEGRLIQVGTPRDIYENPTSLYVAARLGQPAINVIPVSLLPNGKAPPGTTRIGARTEHFRIAKAANGKSQAIVDWVEHLGDQNHLHIAIDGHKVVTLFDPGTELQPGDAVTVELVHPLYFDAAGNRIRGRK